jgi:hypothetical protein
LLRRSVGDQEGRISPSPLVYASGSANYNIMIENRAEQIIDAGAVKNRFAAIRPDDYKNLKMFNLEPGYLRSHEYNREGLTPAQWRRKISELSLRLGRSVKKGCPEPLDNQSALKVFTELAGDIPQGQATVMFYEDDQSRLINLQFYTELNLDFSSLEEDAVEVIERKGINMQQKKEDLIVDGNKLVNEDKSRVRQIVLRDKMSGQDIDVVAKRIRLARVRQDPFEELRVMQKRFCMVCHRQSQ